MAAELRHIEAFLAVARLGSFTRAAAALHVSQPALTVQIRQFEQALGLRLFDRNNRHVALTQAGRELVAPLDRIALDVASVVDHARDLATHRRGVVTVAALPSVAAGILPAALRTLAGRHQGVTVRVRDGVAGRVLDLVRSGDVDLGVSSLTRPDPEITIEPVFEDRLCAIVPLGHRLAHGRRVRLRDLCAEPLILTGPDSSVRQIVERTLEQERLAVHVAQEPTYMTTAIAMVRAGLGIAILPESAVRPASKPEVRAIPVGPPALTRQISLLWRTGRSLSPAAQRFAEVLREAAAGRAGNRRRPPR